MKEWLEVVLHEPGFKTNKKAKTKSRTWQTGRLLKEKRKKEWSEPGKCLCHETKSL